MKHDATRRWSYVWQRLECREAVGMDGWMDGSSQNGTIRRESSGRLFHMRGPFVSPPSGRTTESRDNYCNYRPKLRQRTRKDTRRRTLSRAISMQMPGRATCPATTARYFGKLVPLHGTTRPRCCLSRREYANFIPTRRARPLLR